MTAMSVFKSPWFALALAWAIAATVALFIVPPSGRKR